MAKNYFQWLGLIFCPKSNKELPLLLEKMLQLARKMEIQPQVIKQTKKVTRSGQSDGRLISLPKAWRVMSGEPEKVIMFYGDLIVISTLEDEDRAEKIIELLLEKNLMKPLDNHRHAMRVIN